MRNNTGDLLIANDIILGENLEMLAICRTLGFQLQSEMGMGL